MKKTSFKGGFVYAAKPRKRDYIINKDEIVPLLSRLSILCDSEAAKELGNLNIGSFSLDKYKSKRRDLPKGRTGYHTGLPGHNKRH